MNLMQEIKDLKLPDKTFSYNEIKKIERYTGGVYFIFDYEKQLVYIGKTNCLKNRLFTHFKNHKEYESFKYIQIDDEFEREITETLYINKFRPKNNIDKKYKVKRIKRKGRIIIGDCDEQEEPEEQTVEPSDWFLEIIEELNGMRPSQKQLNEFNKLETLYPEEFNNYIAEKMNKM